MDNEESTREIEIKLLLTALKHFNGHDFSGYSTATLARCLSKILVTENVDNISLLIPEIIYNKEFRQKIIEQLTINVTSLFRDEDAFMLIRNKILPYLASFPRLSIWVAGCAEGEEAYSIAILLAEAGLLSRSHIYATDINKKVLRHAKTGNLRNPIDSWKCKQYERITKGGDLQNYFSKKNKTYTLKPEILSKISFEHHDIIQQPSFLSAQLIMCRNVMIYFKEDFQNKAIKTMDDSLEKYGFFVIGTSETVNNYKFKNRFSSIKGEHGIYQKIKN